MLASRKKKLDICSSCKRAATPAIHAATCGHANCLITAYRELGVFNERDDYGATPIHFAARNGKLDCLDWLVCRSGVSPNAVTVNGNTAAHDAAATGHVECLQYLLEKTRCSLSDTTSEGATVLHIASRFGQTEVVQWLIEKEGCLPGDKGVNAVTPVHLCAAKNHLECLKWLTGHPQYVPNEKTAHGATPVYFAAQEGSLDCLKWLLEEARGHAYQTAGDGMAPIHASAQAGKRECLEYLVKEVNISVRCRADDGATPAHFAAASGQVDCLEWILDNGGSILDRDNLGGTPAHDAAEQGQVDALSCLLVRGVDVLAPDNEGLKPVDLARDNNHEDAYKLLFKVTKSKLLTSMTPEHSLSRAAGLTAEYNALAEAKKKLQVEEAMMAEPANANAPSSEAKRASPDPKVKDSMDVTLQTKRHSSKVSGEKVFQKEPSPDVKDVNAEILRNMVYLQEEKQADLSPERPVSSPKSPTAAGKRGIFSKFFSSRTDRNKKAGIRTVSPNQRKSRAMSPQGRKAAQSPTSPGKKTKRVSSPTKKQPPKVAGSKSPRKVSTKERAVSPSPAAPSGSRGDGKKVRRPASFEVRQRPASVDGSKVVARRRPVSVDGSGVLLSRRPVSTNGRRPVSTDGRRPVSTDGRRPVSTDGRRPVSTDGRRPVSTDGRRPVSTDGRRPVSTDGRRPVSGDRRRPVSNERTPAASGPRSPRKGPKSPTRVTKPTKSAPTKSAPTRPAPARPAPARPAPRKKKLRKKKKKAPPSKSAKVSSKTPPIQQEPRHAAIGEELARRLSDLVVAKPTQEEDNEGVDVYAGDLVTDVLSDLLKGEAEVPHPDLPKAGNEEVEGSEDKAEVGEEEEEKEVDMGIEEGSEEMEEEEVEVGKGIEQHSEVMETTARNMVKDILKQVADSPAVSQPPDPLQAPPPPQATPPPPHTPQAPQATLSPSQAHPPQAPPPPPQAPPPPPIEDPMPKDQVEYREKAVITRSPERKSLETSDESYTVKFITEAPILKRPLPFKHHDLVIDDELSSPGSSGDEDDPKRESFTAPGYSRLNQSSFENFGEDVKDIESQMKQAEKEWGRGRKSIGESLRSSRSSVSPVVQDEIDSVVGVEAVTEDGQSKQESLEVKGMKRESSDVMNLASRFQTPIAKAPKVSKMAVKKISVKKGSVGDRLKMFGGGVNLTTPPAASKEEKRKEEEKKEEEEKKKTEEEEKRKKKEEEEKRKEEEEEKKRKRSRDESSQLEALQQKRPTSSSSPHKRSSTFSTISFETIEEEASNTSLNAEESTESLDKVVPLQPNVPGPSLSRRQSQELQRIDGIQHQSDAEEPLKVDSAQKMSTPGTNSPLLSSTKKGTSLYHRTSGKNLKEVRSVSSPESSLSSKGSEALALFMNSANLPHLNSLLAEDKEREKKRATKVTNTLLSMPRWTGASVQIKFHGLKTDDRSKIQIWKQHGVIMSQLKEFKQVQYGPKDVYLFLHVRHQGPVLYHVYLWLGRKVHGSALEDAFKHAQNLVHCLPGKAIIHKEAYGYETYHFHQMLGKGRQSLLDHHISVSNYLHFEAGECILIEYYHATESFKRVETKDCSYRYISTCKNPLLLTTPTCVYLWVPEGYWAKQLKGDQQLALVITELFVTQCSHPKWTPVIIVTQNAEDWLFSNHFPDWQGVNLELSSKASKLRLPLLRTPSTSYPVTGQMKVWTLENEKLQNVSLDNISHFFNDKVHLVYYRYQNQNALEEGVLYLWVGSMVKTAREKIVEQVLKELPSAKLDPKLPMTIVPEGKEPTELLYLFKGKFVIHTTHNESKTYRLYELSGSGAMSVRTREVPAQASSLHSSLVFFLMEEGNMGYVWSGQFAEKSLRRGALVIAKMLTESNDMHKLAEGLEVPHFWLALGGQGKHEHFLPSPNVMYAPPLLYSVIFIKHTAVFTKQQLSIKKKDLLSNACYFIDYKDQLMLRIGKDWEAEHSPSKIVEEYIGQHHGFQRETDFVATVVHEDNEGKAFWKCFKLQDSATVMEAPSELVLPVEDIEDVDFDMEEQDASSTTAATAESAAASISLAESIDKSIDEMTSQLEGMLGEVMAGPLEGIPEVAAVKGKDIAEDITTEVATGKGKKTEVTLETVTVKGKDKPEATLEVVVDVNAMSQGPPPPTLSPESSRVDLPLGIDRAAKSLIKKPTARGPKVSVKVMLVEMGKEVEVQVRSTMAVLNVISKAAEAGDARLDVSSTLFEASEHLEIERALEDHEVIGDVMSLWPTKNCPILLLKKFADKNDLWTKKCPIPKQAVTAFTKNRTVPNVRGELHHCKKGGSRLKWKLENCVLQESGIFTTTEHSDKKTLSCGLDHLLYTPMTVKGKTIDSPTPHCFIMKHPTSWKDKDMKLYSAQDANSFSQWVHSIRLVKHGLQLKGNYIAAKKKLGKQLEKQLFEEAVTVAMSD